MLYIVGIGPGSKEYILPKATEILRKSDILIGFSRALESVEDIKAKKVVISELKQILDITYLNQDKSISVIASGDPGFYGISNYIRSKYNGELEIIPGLSSFQYLMAKLNKSWQGCHLGSLHGREESFLEEVGKNKLSIWLTDKSNSPAALCKRLYEANIKAKVYVGEDLSYEDESISFGTPEELMNNSFGDLTVVVIENDLL